MTSNFYLLYSIFFSLRQFYPHCSHQSIDRNKGPHSLKNYKGPKINKQRCIAAQCTPNTVQYIIKFSIYRNVFHRIQKIGEEYDTNADRTDNIIIRHSKELSNSVKLIFFLDMSVK